MSEEVIRARKALEELQAKQEDDFDTLMNNLKEALVRQYWEKMTRYVK